MQTTRWSTDDNEVHPKRPEKGGRRCGYPKQRIEAIDSPTPRIEAGAVEKRHQDETDRRRQFTERKAEEISTNAEEKCRNLKRRRKRHQGKCRRSRKPELKTKGRPRPKGKKTELRVRPCAWGSYVQGSCGTRVYTRAGPIIESEWRRRRYSDGNTKRSQMDVGMGNQT